MRQDGPPVASGTLQTEPGDAEDRPALRGTPRSQGGSVVEEIEELAGMVRSYAYQETVEPLKRVGRFLAFGVSGAVGIAIGLSFALVGLLRLFETETHGTFAGRLSWVPYLLVAVVALVLVGVTAWQIPRRVASKRDAAARYGQRVHGR